MVATSIGFASDQLHDLNAAGLPVVVALRSLEGIHDPLTRHAR